MPWDNEFEDEEEWQHSEEFRRVVKNFYSLNQVITKFSGHVAELNSIMKDFQFALVQLYEKYPDMLDNSPEGKKLVEASQRLSNFDWKSFMNPKS